MGTNTKYSLRPDIEHAVAGYMAKEPKFFSRVGHALEPDSFKHPAVQHVVRAALAIGKDLGRGPSDDKLVLQRLERWRNEGKVTVDQIAEVDELLGDIYDQGLPPLNDLVNEVSHEVRRARQIAALELGMETYGKHGEMDRVMDLLTEAGTVGKHEERAALRIDGKAGFQALDTMRKLGRLKTGIRELDEHLGGGVYQGSQVVFAGGTGDGKSMALSHVAGAAMLQGHHVAVATLELSEELWFARSVANISDVTIDDIVSGEGAAAAAERIDHLCRGGLGLCAIKWFTAQVSTAAEIMQWFDEESDALERETGERYTVLVVDYADKVGHANADDAYRGQGTVYETFRVGMKERNGYNYTASQTKRKDKGKKQDIDDLADSQNKARVADVVIPISCSEDQEEVEFTLGKNRLGAGRKTAGPMPTEFTFGRICAMDLGDCSRTPTGVVDEVEFEFDYKP